MRVKEDDDHALVERVVSGDEAAFHELIQKYERLIRHITFRMLSDSRDREEIMQDVLLRVYRSLPNFAFRSRLSTWIGQIAYRQCLTYVGRAAASAMPDVSAEDQEAESLVSETPDSLQEMMLDEARALVRSSIDALPLNQRVTVTLYYLDGLGIDEIAEIIEMAPGTVKSHLHRARLALKNGLHAHYMGGDL